MTDSKSSEIKETDIEKIIEDYLKNVPPLKQKFMSAPQFQEENLMFNIFGQEQYLLISKFDLSKLPVKLLRRLPVYLIKQFIVQVELDSLWYWSLVHDIVKSPSEHNTFQQWHLLQAFETLMSAHFAKLGSAPMTPAIDRLNRVLHDVVPQPVQDLVQNNQIILMYICYPVLEGLVKYAMTTMVDSDGVVITSFTEGKKKHNSGCQISSLAQLLRALEENASSLLSKPDLSIDLKDYRLEIEKMIPKNKVNDDGWDSIYKLRNISLHGTVGWQLRSGLITNLICLIMCHLIDNQAIMNGLQGIASRPQHFFWPGQYYPPEL